MQLTQLFSYSGKVTKCEFAGEAKQFALIEFASPKVGPPARHCAIDCVVSYPLKCPFLEPCVVHQRTLCRKQSRP